MKKQWLLALSLLLSLPVFPQPKITLSITHQPLTAVFQQLGENYGLKFAYDNDRADQIYVTATLQETSPEEALRILLKNTGLGYTLIDNVYVITPLNPSLSSSGEPGEVPLCKLSGVVRDALSGEHLPYATIVITSTHKGIVANSDGFFTLWVPSSDSIRLQVSYIGYVPMDVKIAQPQKNVPVIIEMKRAIQEMPPAVVHSSQQQVFELNQLSGSVTLNPAKMVDMPSLAEQDIVTPLQLMPGVDATTESSSGLTIRKAPSDKNLILFDGMTIYQIDHFYGMISSFNSKAIKEIQLYKNTLDARYGGRSSGLIEITGKSGNMYHASAQASMDMWSVDGMLEVPVVKEKLSLVLTGRRSYTDYYQSPLFSTLYNKTRYDLQNYYMPQAYLTAFKAGKDFPSFYFYDATAKLTYKPSLKDVMSLSWYRGTDRMYFSTSDTTPFIRIEEKSELNNEGVSFRWGRKWTPSYYSTFVGGFSSYSAFINHEDTSSIRAINFISFYGLKRYYEVSNSIRDIHFDFYHQYQWNSEWSAEFGVAENLYRTTAEYTQIFSGDSSLTKKTAPIQNVNTLYSSLTAFYLQGNFSKGSLLSCKAGVRAEYFSLTREAYYAPRFSVLYRIHPSLSAKASAGIAYQYVNRLSYQTDFRNIWTMADNKTSPVVSCRHVMLGAVYQINPGFQIDVELFYRRMYGIPYGMLVYRMSKDSLYNVESDLYINYLVQKTGGVDVLVKKSFGKYQTWLGYSLSETNLFYNSWLKKKTGSVREYFPYGDDQLHEIKWYHTLQYKQWNFSLSWIFGSGKPWNYYRLDEKMDYLPFNINSMRLTPYHRMDAGAQYHVFIGKVEIKTGINIFNVYNRHNQRSILMKLKPNAGLEAVTGGEPLQVADIYGLGFTPNLFVDVRF